MLQDYHDVKIFIFNVAYLNSTNEKINFRLIYQVDSTYIYIKLSHQNIEAL